MKSYELVFGDISPMMKNDIKNVLECKIGMKPKKNGDIVYTVTSYGNNIPEIQKRNVMPYQKCITRNILPQDTLWNNFLFHIPKTNNTVLMSSSYVYDDVSSQLIDKTHYKTKLSNTTDNLIIVGNQLDLLSLDNIKDNYPQVNIELITLHSNITFNCSSLYDTIHIISTYYGDLLSKSIVNVIDVADIITDRIISDFYSM